MNSNLFLTLPITGVSSLFRVKIKEMPLGRPTGADAKVRVIDQLEQACYGFYLDIDFPPLY